MISIRTNRISYKEIQELSYYLNIYSNIVKVLDMIANQDFESAQQKYKPKKIKHLLIAEAPPKIESGRYFYFENVQKGPTLFLEIMKVLYPDDVSKINVLEKKPQLLKRFKDDGFYLIDASDTPMEDIRPAKKKKQLEKSLPSLVHKVRNLISEDTKIILISKTVYEICYDRLRSEGFNVINKTPIPFPGSGWQIKSREKLSALLKES